MMPARIISASITDIEDHLIDYFARMFNKPTTFFVSSTNVKTTFNFGDAAWAHTADEINRLAWMRHLNVRIAQGDMGSNQTIGQLTILIWNKVAHLLVGSALPRSVTSLSSLTQGKKKRAAKKTVAAAKKNVARKRTPS
jgi:hypothetical protein